MRYIMKIEKLKLWLLAGTLGVAVTTSIPALAATSTTMTTTTTTGNPSRQEIRADQMAADQQVKQLNDQYHQQRKLLVQQLHQASAQERPAIKEELKQANRQHALEVRQVRQNLHAQVRAIRQDNNAASTGPANRTTRSNNRSY